MCAQAAVFEEWGYRSALELRMGRGGHAAVGFVPAVRIASSRLPDRPQLSTFYTGRRTPTPTTQLTRLPPCHCSSESVVRLRAPSILVSASTRASGPLEGLSSGSCHSGRLAETCVSRAFHNHCFALPMPSRHESPVAFRPHHTLPLLTQSSGTAFVPSPLPQRVVVQQPQWRRQARFSLARSCGSHGMPQQRFVLAVTRGKRVLFSDGACGTVQPVTTCKFAGGVSSCEARVGVWVTRRTAGEEVRCIGSRERGGVGWASRAGRRDELSSVARVQRAGP
ncbi:hypothetical protein C8Q79DRAFT_202670 [Trametes meyenii]|nr:hypothetical protein C8Q79DRAFT_202670 [Trametes meyenii]